MYKLRFIVIVLFLGQLSPVAYSQKSVEPSESDIKIAKEIKAVHEDDRLAALTNSNIFTFEYDPKSDKVIVNDVESEELISLSPKVRYSPSIFYDDMSSVQNIKASYKNGKKVNIDLKDEYYNIDEYFYSDARTSQYNLDFQNIGNRYKIGHLKKIHDIKYFTSSYFHTVYPVQKRRIEYIVPDWLEVELKEINFEGYAIKKEKEYIDKIKSTRYIFEMSEIGKMSNESGAPGNSHIYPHILLLSKSYTVKGIQKPLFNSAKDLYGWYKQLAKGVDNDISFIKNKTEELVANQDSDEDKIKSIFYWVQDNIRYIAFEDGIAGFQPDNCQNVYKNKYGDCKGMANLTKQMLIIAGYDARLTWIGTKRIAYDYSLPTMAVDNHMICTVILDGKQIFLDPTEKYSSLEEYAGRIEGRQVMIENGEDFILSTVPEMKPEDNSKTIINHLSINEDNLVGEVNRKYTGESKSYILYQVNNEETDELDDALNEFITRRNKNLLVKDLKTSDMKERDDILTMDYQIVQKNSISSFGEEMYLDIDLYKEYSNYDFEEDRKVGYMFPYKSNTIVETEIDIPDGYIISELPEAFKKENEIYDFDMYFKHEGGKLIYKKKITIKKDKLPKSSLSDWNQTIKALNDFYSEQVILKKSK